MAQHYNINKTHAPENVNYLPPAPFDGPVLDGQIGINLGRMEASLEVTPCRSTPKRERRRWHGDQEQRASLIVPLLPCTTVLHKRQKALMKTSGGFRSKADTQKMSFFSPLSLLTLPLGRIIQKSHLVEMSSCGGGGASSVTECCNASRAGALATLPRPSRPDLAGADICRHIGVKKWTLCASSSWKVLATAS